MLLLPRFVSGDERHVHSALRIVGFVSRHVIDCVQRRGREKEREMPGSHGIMIHVDGRAHPSGQAAQLPSNF